MIQLPKIVVQALNRLEQAGFEGWVVGGCVRDSLLGHSPHDWDITTNALPEQVAALFADLSVILTGTAHGTVTVMMHGEPLEITTYRVDGNYRDRRHPDGVRFVTDITEDLRRRDFTVNAMAWHPIRGLCDPYGGAEDARRGILRCVGNAQERFSEDALRILRALRFAATYGFAVEQTTAAALHRCAPLLTAVAAERIQAEINRLLTGASAGCVLHTFFSVLYPILPELRALEGFEQHSPYHDRDVLYHTLDAVDSAPPELVVRLALLLHDIGKPRCYTIDENGHGHFYGHAAESERMASEILHRLKYDRRTCEAVCTLVKYHDTPIADTDTAVRRCLNRWGEERVVQLLAVQEGDTRAHAACVQEERLATINKLRERVTRIVAEGQCVSLKTLAVSGHDLLHAGIPSGRAVGHLLNWMLEEVLAERLPNDRDKLLSAAMQQKDLIISQKNDTIN